MIRLTSSYLLGATADLPEWMIDILADDYGSTIHGTHGFGLHHPRAPWLTLVVSDREECECGAAARWEESPERGFCPRCVEAEIALAHAARGAVPRRPPRFVHAYETGPTVVDPYVVQFRAAGGLQVGEGR